MLKVGTMVSIGGGEFSQVIAFTHADKSSAGVRFIRLTTADGKSIRATPGHLIYININGNNNLVPMRSVRIGDTITISTSRATNRYAQIAHIDVTKDTGLFNPQTASGNILVDDVFMSTYTEAIHPILAHSLLSPIRMAWKINSMLSKQTTLPRSLPNLKGFASNISTALRLYGLSFASGT